MQTMTAAEVAARHNAGVAAQAASPVAGHNVSLKSYLDRLVELEEQKQALATDVRELKAEAKEHDIDPRALAVMAKRQMEDAEQKAKRVSFEETVDSYAAALGMLL